MTEANPTEDAAVEGATPVLSSEDRVATANSIVKKNMYWAMGAGCVPVPFADLVGITAFQAVMIKELSDHYDVRFSDRIARNLVVALLGSLSARVITAGLVGSFLKFIPGIGSVVSSLLAAPAVAGAVTYAVGRVFIKHFEDGGTLLDLDVDKVRSFFNDQYKLAEQDVVEAEPANA